MLVLFRAANSAPAADLLAVYQRALQNDPQLREAEATRLAALEAKPQALSALLPQLAGNGLVSKERDVGSSEHHRVGAAAALRPTSPGTPCAPAARFDAFESFRLRHHDTTIHHYSVDLKQNLFRWENWEALKRADSQVAQAEADYQAAQQDLMERVCAALFRRARRAG